MTEKRTVAEIQADFDRAIGCLDSAITELESFISDMGTRGTFHASPDYRSGNSRENRKP